jgi:hypothetical protein
MSTLALSQAIGKLGTLASDKLYFDVRIIDAKLAYGNLRYQVTPVSGTGSVWVDSSRVKILDNSTPKCTCAVPLVRCTIHDGPEVLSVSEQN